jgi:hypothetical protein
VLVPSDVRSWSTAPVLLEPVRHRQWRASQPPGWAFHDNDGETNLPDEVGYHFADERFPVGEYVSLNEGGKMHTYRVTSASYL